MVFRMWNQVLFRDVNGKDLIINCVYKRAVDNIYVFFEK